MFTIWRDFLIPFIILFLACSTKIIKQIDRRIFAAVIDAGVKNKEPDE